MILRLIALICVIAGLTQHGSACLSNLQGSRCCRDIGTAVCFSRSTFFTALPDCPINYAATLTLYTQNNAGGTRFTLTSIPTTFSNTRPTTIIVHGWRQSVFNSDFQELIRVILARADNNVIAVDWQAGASSLTYLTAAANTQSIGAYIGSLVNQLRMVPTATNVNPYFWCIGHGLGAHACGFSRMVAAIRLDRITGLDPSGPLFPQSTGLTQASATNVDVIHTDIIYGSLIPRGHVDFYPNGGRGQPGCALTFATGRSADPEKMTDQEKIKLIQQAASQTGRAIPIVDCSHQRALFYMIHSVRNPVCYTAGQTCDNVAFIPATCNDIPANMRDGQMGYRATLGRYMGNLYFKSGPISPFCSV